MRIWTLVAPVFGANCHVLAWPDGRCVVIDPGAGVTGQVHALLGREDLRPVAVLATHGHADHVWDAGPLCADLDLPLRIHAADAYRLADPFGTLGLSAGGPLVSGPLADSLHAAGIDVTAYRAPERIETFGSASEAARSADVDLDDLAGGALGLVARHAPGHTEGSTFYLLPADDDAASLQREPTVFTGDVLFAGSIGRTDLPGGDDARMRRTLREVVGALDPAALVRAGHGPDTTIGTELARNPYLRGIR